MIKTYVPEVQEMLVNQLSVPVYESEVPESADLPAVAYYNIGYANDRVVNGRKINDTMSFRVMIVAKSVADMTTALTEIGELDNTKNDNFQRIEVVGNNLEAKLTDIDIRRMMIDLTLTV